MNLRALVAALKDLEDSDTPPCIFSLSVLPWLWPGGLTQRHTGGSCFGRDDPNSPLAIAERSAFRILEVGWAAPGRGSNHTER